MAAGDVPTKQSGLDPEPSHQQFRVRERFSSSQQDGSSASSQVRLGYSLPSKIKKK
jgi:hypothetical protein